MKILFIICLLIQTASFASTICEGTKVELGRIAPDIKTKLVACGVKSKNTVNDLEIIQIKEGQYTLLFASDDAFKTYRFREQNGSFFISEALSNFGDFNPFVEIKTACNKGLCEVVDHKCLWKKSSIEAAKKLELHSLLKQKRNCEKLAARVNDFLEAALNGDQLAVQFFSNIDVGCSAEGSEALMTYREDIKRLKKLKCIQSAEINDLNASI